MLSFATLRKFFRIPWVRDNRDAVYFFSDTFYLLITLYRAGRIQEFIWLRNHYLKMMDSFALYGQAEAKSTIDQLLGIPWFCDKRWTMHRAISGFKQVIELLNEADDEGFSTEKQGMINDLTEEFINNIKIIYDFNDKDEERVRLLLEEPEVMNQLLKRISDSIESEK